MHFRCIGYILLEMVASDIIMKETSRFVHKTDEYIPQTIWNFLSKNGTICTISANLAKVYLKIKKLLPKINYFVAVYFTGRWYDVFSTKAVWDSTEKCTDG